MVWKPQRLARPSPREQRERIVAAHQYIAVQIADPQKRAEYEAKFCKPLPPKRDKIRRPVDGRPIGPTEHQVQSAVIGWWWRVHHGYKLPSFALFAIPNGGARDVITGARLRDEGVRRGTPDLCLAVARGVHHGLYLEMKIGSGRISEEQGAFLDYLNGAGYKAVVHYSTEDAITEIQGYLA